MVSVKGFCQIFCYKKFRRSDRGSVFLFGKNIMKFYRNQCGLKGYSLVLDIWLEFKNNSGKTGPVTKGLKINIYNTFSLQNIYILYTRAITMYRHNTVYYYLYIYVISFALSKRSLGWTAPEKGARSSDKLAGKIGNGSTF